MNSEIDKKKSIVMAASYGGPYGGNFIPSLIAYNTIVKKMGYQTVYVFPHFVSEYDWVKDIKPVADKLYFINYKPYSFDNIKQIRNVCKKEKAVLIYSRMGGWDLTARFAMPKLPLVWHFEMGLDLSNVKNKIKYWIKYRILGFGKTYHIAVSEAATQTINSLNPINECVWIPNAINLDRLSKKEAYNWHNPIRLLTFAYQPIIKGFDIAIKACEKLNQNDVNYELYASAQKHTYEYIRELYGDKKPDWIKLLEPTDKINTLFDSADILLCPSRTEGLSFANLEGMYSGLPIVYSTIPGNSLLSEFSMTYCFTTESFEDLARAIKDCSASKVEIEKQRTNRSIIEEKYSMNAWMNRISDFLLQVL